MIGHLIYNYEHFDDLKIQQEISKSLYVPLFNGVHLVHAYNGKREFKYKPYLEDKLITIKNRGHFKGAIDLINEGLTYFSKNKIPGLKYVLVTAADTWLLNTAFLEKVIQEMQDNEQVLAASSWGRSVHPAKPTGFSTDFFIIDIEWNRKTKLFPVDYDGFLKKFSDLFALQYSIPIVEAAVQYKYAKYFNDTLENNDIGAERNKKFRRLKEREPVHNEQGMRYHNYPKIGLYTNPDPIDKQKVLKKLKQKLGPNTDRLITAKNLEYYNKISNHSNP